MVKPRVFVSSTYYDLKHIRNSLKNFIEDLGYEAVLFEDGDIPYDHLLSLDQSCYLEVTRCHMLVLIIGGCYGSLSSESIEDNDNYNPESITIKEYKTARDKNVPTFVFIEKNVSSEYQTYKANIGGNVNYVHVNNVKIFEFIDQIYSQKIGTQIHEFDKFEDISNWLRDQWAGLFAEYLKQRQDQKILLSISSKIDELSQVSEALRTYTESLMKELKPEGFHDIIEAASKSIEDTKKKNFYNHIFPGLIMERANAYGVNLNEGDIYPVFTQTNSLEEFLSKLGFSDETIDNITNLCIYTEQYMELKYGIHI
ncbi:DUF4062 domain-containing protein [Methanosarcina sp.]|uniref:DUF4062 domain-containing protein n=1 Tax=Methanosarcina sp. TaxID=2213 RepID=UPI003C74ACD2